MKRVMDTGGGQPRLALNAEAAGFPIAAMAPTLTFPGGGMIPIIGLTGPEGSGKTTVANMLVARFGYACEPFAKPLKSMIGALGVPPKYIHGSQEQKEAPLDILGGRSARYALRTLGTEWGRDLISPGLWVHHWKRRAYGRLVVADDVRFDNEVIAVEELHGIVVRIAGRGRETGAHRSDTSSQLRVHAVVVNDGTLEDLYERVLTAISP